MEDKDNGVLNNPRKVEKLKKSLDIMVKNTKEIPTPSIKEDDIKQAEEILDRQNRLRSDSGNVEFSDTLTTFLYFLLRDHMSAGKLELVVREVTEGPEVVTFANGFLAQYADNLATELKNAKTNMLERALESAFGQSEAKRIEKVRIKRDVHEARFGEVEIDLLQLKEKVDNAVENMSEEEKSELEETMLKFEDEIKIIPIVREVGKFSDKDKKDITEKQAQIASSLDAIEYLKANIPSDNVKTLTDILKAEVNAELTDEFKAKLQTRESILEKRAEENKEHKATNPEAERAAAEYIEDQLSDDDTTDEDEGEGVSSMSRGTVRDVAVGAAFPEALGKVFNE